METNIIYELKLIFVINLLSTVKQLMKTINIQINVTFLRKMLVVHPRRTMMP